jgi:predicted nucleotidyltransferase
VPPKIAIDRERLGDFCRRWKITELSLFGSILRDDFRPDSDVDVLVSFADDARWTLLDHARMTEELRLLFGRPVDLLTRRAVERSQNPLRREGILAGSEALYVQG